MAYDDVIDDRRGAWYQRVAIGGELLEGNRMSEGVGVPIGGEVIDDF